MLSPRVNSRLISSISVETRYHDVQVCFMPGKRDYSLNIEYLGRLQITITGRFTGAAYRFNPFQPTQKVDPRDAFYLLASRRFGVAS